MIHIRLNSKDRTLCGARLPSEYTTKTNAHLSNCLDCLEVNLKNCQRHFEAAQRRTMRARHAMTVEARNVHRVPDDA